MHKSNRINSYAGVAPSFIDDSSTSTDKREDLDEIPANVIEVLQLEEENDGFDDKLTQAYIDNSLTSIPATGFSDDNLNSSQEPPNYLTFRYFILSIIFVIPGAFMDTLNSYRTTSAPYSILFVQFLAYPLGKWLSEVLPNKTINLRIFKFNLNPYPWSIKESVLITLTAASGATGNQGTVGISLAKVFYDIDISPAVSLLFMYGIVWTGYSFAAIARNFVLYDPKFVWPRALMQTSLFKLQTSQDTNDKNRIFIFSIALVAMFIWQFLPEFMFPLLSSLAVLCWIAPYNNSLNFLGSGLGGAGLLNITLDWSNITSEVMLSPYSTILLQFLGFALTCWVFLPACKWLNNGEFARGLMDNHLMFKNGTRYPVSELITPDLKFNQTAYDLLGPIHYSSHRLFNIFFDYAAYISALAWLLTFGLKDLKNSYNKLKSASRPPLTNETESSPLLAHHPSLLSVNSESQFSTSTTISAKSRNNPLKHNISSLYSDRINQRYAIYDDVPASWFIVLFVVSFIALFYLCYNELIFMPWKTYIVSLLVGSIIVTPLAYLYATSNFQLAIGTFNELLYGTMIQNRFFLPKSGMKHPVGGSIYGAVAGNCWYRAQFLLQDQKVGIYNQIPPKQVFISQIFGDLIGVPFNYMALKYVLNNKLEYLQNKKQDPLHQWTGQILVNYSANSAQYVLIGPKKLFEEYPFLPYGFAIGIITPILIGLLYKKTKWSRLKKFNPTIIFSSMSRFYGNVSTGYFTQFLLGSFTMHYMQNYHHHLFAAYNYVLAAAFDTGFNLCNVVLFVLFSGGFFSNNGEPVVFPHWWGNDATNIEKCYAL